MVKTKGPGSLSAPGAAWRGKAREEQAEEPISSSKQKSLNTLALLIVDSVSLKGKIHPKEGFCNLLNFIVCNLKTHIDVYRVCRAHRHQKRASNSLELELHSRL